MRASVETCVLISRAAATDLDLAGTVMTYRGLSSVRMADMSVRPHIGALAAYRINKTSSVSPEDGSTKRSSVRPQPGAAALDGCRSSAALAGEGQVDERQQPSSSRRPDSGEDAIAGASPVHLCSRRRPQAAVDRYRLAGLGAWRRAMARPALPPILRLRLPDRPDGSNVGPVASCSVFADAFQELKIGRFKLD